MTSVAVDSSLPSVNEELVCPLCCDEIAPADKYFFPCPCGYQICRFCWNHIREDLNQLCPACRRSYNDESVQFRPIPADELARLNADRKRKAKGRNNRNVAQLAATYAGDGDRSVLRDVKVTLPTQVVILGIPPKHNNIQNLSSELYFGQFGRIVSISHSRRPPLTVGGKTGENQIAVNVKYSTVAEAIKAISYIDDSTFDGHALQATFATARYCGVWVAGRECNRQECQNLHEYVPTGSDPAPFVPPYKSAGPRTFSVRNQRKGMTNATSLSSLSSKTDPPPANIVRSSSTSSFSRSNARSRSPETSQSGPALPSTASWASPKPVETPRNARSTSPTNHASMPSTARSKDRVKEKGAVPPDPTASASPSRSKLGDTKQDRRSNKQQGNIETTFKPDERKNSASKPRGPFDSSDAEHSKTSDANKQTKTRPKHADAKFAAPLKSSLITDAFSTVEDDWGRTPSPSFVSNAISPPHFDLGALVLQSMPVEFPVLDSTAISSPVMSHLQQLERLDADDNEDLKASSSADHSKSPTNGGWMLASSRVVLKALERSAPAEVYLGNFRPFDMGDLMTDILNEKTHLDTDRRASKSELSNMLHQVPLTQQISPSHTSYGSDRSMPNQPSMTQRHHSQIQQHQPPLIPMGGSSSLSVANGSYVAPPPGYGLATSTPPPHLSPKPPLRLNNSSASDRSTEDLLKQLLFRTGDSTGAAPPINLSHPIAQQAASTDPVSSRMYPTGAASTIGESTCGSVSFIHDENSPMLTTGMPFNDPAIMSIRMDFNNQQQRGTSRSNSLSSQGNNFQTPQQHALATVNAVNSVPSSSLTSSATHAGGASPVTSGGSAGAADHYHPPRIPTIFQKLQESLRATSAMPPNGTTTHSNARGPPSPPGFEFSGEPGASKTSQIKPAAGVSPAKRPNRNAPHPESAAPLAVPPGLKPPKSLPIPSPNSNVAEKQPVRAQEKHEDNAKSHAKEAKASNTSKPKQPSMSDSKKSLENTPKPATAPPALDDSSGGKKPKKKKKQKMGQTELEEPTAASNAREKPSSSAEAEKTRAKASRKVTVNGEEFDASLFDSPPQNDNSNLSFNLNSAASLPEFPSLTEDSSSTYVSELLEQFLKEQGLSLSQIASMMQAVESSVNAAGETKDTGKSISTTHEQAAGTTEQGSASFNMPDLGAITLGITSFFDSSAAAIFGHQSSKRETNEACASGRESNGGVDSASAEASGKRGSTASHAALTALLQSLGSGEDLYASEADLVALEEQVAFAKKEAAMWELKLKQVMKKNRKFGLA